MLGASAHLDTFSRDHLPPAEPWPNSCSKASTIREAECRRRAHRSHGRARLRRPHRVDRPRPAQDLQGACRLDQQARPRAGRGPGVVPGNRVLIRSANNPAMVACWLAALKAGAVVVNTVPSLTAAELGKAIDKAEVKLALCDTRLTDELVTAAKKSRFLQKVVGFDGTANFDAELDRIALGKPVLFDAVKRAATMSRSSPSRPARPETRKRRCTSIAISSRLPTATRRTCWASRQPMSWSARPRSPTPLGSAGSSFSRSASAPRRCCLRRRRPPILSVRSRPTRRRSPSPVPSIYHRILALKCAPKDLASLRCAVSAGDALPPKTFESWTKRYGIPLLDGIGGTEMLHIFISSRLGETAAGICGRPVPATRRNLSMPTCVRCRADIRPSGGPRPDRLPLSRRSEAARLRA